MSKPNKNRIPLTSSGEGLGNPFASALDNLQGLKSGPETPPPKPETPARAHVARVILRKETAHRAGTAVIVVHGFPASVTDAEIETLARELKKACGVGGTVKDREIEIQGEKTSQIRQFLEKNRFRVDGIR